VEGVLVAFKSLSTIKMAQAATISNRSSPFRSFCDNSFNTKCPGLKEKK
jgi:hypothetical protein